ncbi:LOW QUALITY PROTEIN: fatty acyl-CoA reductase 6, chloroplastic [Arabidopsis lyrata subsp. lyrata]|uniref:LOW QUALITY PROTEIN: fatty acyl-CoA reductase 6, chloroplastic n=1 Tax=Arabidopsis lyrata subsp. lyrata TaxID=81972 RepID=UPI000A29A9F5|nr:LOW QUALITY PROTEIN: fatty acyl-CoA reductase 6, chloroplastic [Arabidopsis lyrata subsp. lyrata]|eukprot:XP_020881912.1 LOW QUALITY PROTEIN: fatty acyl-CoA reductase 6, chloroplastic [Arabidopsis lyrata subsp. lyrata]
MSKGKIFLLIKANAQEAAKKRLMMSFYFQIHPSILSKLIPVVGDIAEDNSETSLKISEEIDIIISSAARTTFADRFLCFFCSVFFWFCFFCSRFT